MSRPPLTLGAWGRVSRTKLSAGGWAAKARVRDLDGVTRLVERRGRTGAAAERALTAALIERTVPTADTLTADSKLADLWRAYEAHLIEEGRAIKTMQRYRYGGDFIVAGLGGLRIRECSVQRLDRFIQSVKVNQGPSVAKTCRIVLSGMFGIAVRYNAADRNPVRDVSPIKTEHTASRALSGDELRGIVHAVYHSNDVLDGTNKITPGQTISEYAARADIADVIVLFSATGARIGEVLGIRWSDLDLDAGTLAITGKVIRDPGHGLIRETNTKTASGHRVVALPRFAIDALTRRQAEAAPNHLDLVFPSATGGLRDAAAVDKSWRRVRMTLGYPWVTGHTFRRSVATLIDGAGLTARIGADQLGHRRVSMTQDVYMGRKIVHNEVADVLDRMIR